jgi:hypothetical protein
VSLKNALRCLDDLEGLIRHRYNLYGRTNRGIDLIIEARESIAAVASEPVAQPVGESAPAAQEAKAVSGPTSSAHLDEPAAPSDEAVLPAARTRKKAD